jgi:hypothetical protein
VPLHTMADIRHHPTTHHSDAFVAADAIHRKRGPTEWPGPLEGINLP